MDATIVSKDGLLRPKFEEPLRRERYLRKLRELQTNKERWQAMRQAAPLPRWWRFRKMLHVMAPQTTVVVKRALSVFHSKR
jgi:hypothetical protein